MRSLGNVVHQLARCHLLVSGVAPFSALSARVRFFLIVHHLKCLISLFGVSVDDLAGHNIPQGPDWRRLTILFAWYLAGIPTAYVMHDSCAVGAPGIWARAIRVFIEGLVAFGLGGLIYVRHFSTVVGSGLTLILYPFVFVLQALGRYLFPVHQSRLILLPFPAEKASLGPGALMSDNAVDSV